ncbi:RDD family protein [Halioxenophilus sp. WMMB6]|uniref:RDD family protein n=1 Tax=Halioxenophilus sp. WMMB6 TaxID=3073815 RepID=UPI00295EDB3E|nr:RDD family protein [Halioxenophilus sp. WMMB6]
MTEPSPYPHAPLWRKLAALLYDSLLIAAVSMAYGSIALTLKMKILGYQLQAGERATLGLPGLLGWITVLVLFFAFFWRRGGQTLGMRAWRLRLVNMDNQRPSWLACIARALLAGLSFAALGAGYWWQWLDRDHLTLHDRLSQTKVLLLPKNRK